MDLGESLTTTPWVVVPASALSLVLGQYPYLYLTVAFIQMLKAFSPAYMVIFLYCLGVECARAHVLAVAPGLLPPRGSSPRVPAPLFHASGCRVLLGSAAAGAAPRPGVERVAGTLLRAGTRRAR